MSEFGGALNPYNVLDMVNGDISRDYPENCTECIANTGEELYFHQLMVVDRHGLSCSGWMREG